MTGTNDDFDLPRWQTQAHLEPLSSSAQAAQAAANQSAYGIYASAPPPPPPQSQSLASNAQRLHQSATGSSRQPRITHLQEQQSSYLNAGHNQLARSASLGGAAAAAPSSRGRRHHQPDDLEGAFGAEGVGMNSSRQPASSQHSFYPPSVPYHQGGSTAAASNPTSPSTEQYPDLYFGSSNNPPKRAQTHHDASTSSRAARSPMQTSNGSNTALLDPYGQQQAQYSPTGPSYAPFGPPPDNQRGHGSPAYQSHTHSRSHSQVKTEILTTPLVPPYSPQGPMQSGFSPTPYTAMESSSPQPPSSHLASNVPMKSTSTPGTPLSYLHSSQSPPGQYYPGDQAMVVEPPQQKRRASGFRRVRDARDLRPFVNSAPAGRRMDATGVYLSVSQM